MRQRKYSIREIDEMRGYLLWMNYNQKEFIEDMLRTYMLNGTDPSELREVYERYRDNKIAEAKAMNARRGSDSAIIV